MATEPKPLSPGPGALLVWSTSVAPLGALLANAEILDDVAGPAYPTPMYVLAAITGVVAQILVLAMYPGKSRATILWRAFCTGLFAACAGWFALYFLPILPLLVFTVFVGIGLLGLAPYWSVAAAIPVTIDIMKKARAVSAEAPALAMLIAGLALPPLLFVGHEVWRASENRSFRAALEGDVDELHTLVRSGAHRAVATALRTHSPDYADGAWCRPEAMLLRSERLSHRELRELYYLLTGEVHDRVRALRLVGSELDIASDVRADLCYLDWKMTVHNNTGAQQEARMTLLLPEGTVPCDLTLWVNGREQPAAFASTETTTRAYESIVRRRLDPALLTDEGGGRVALRVFPVPPWSTAKVRVGFSMPFVAASQQRYRGLPVFLDRNFTLATAHALRVDEGEVQHLASLTDDFRGSRVVGRRVPRGWARDRRGNVIVQTLDVARRQPAAKGPILLVMERSAPFRPARFDARALEATLRRLDIEAHVLMIGPRDSEHRTFLRGEPGLAQFVAAQRFAGGVDTTSGLRRAFRLLDEIDVARVIWLAGPLPVETDSFTTVYRRFQNGVDHPWHVVPCAAQNRLVDKLLDQNLIHAVAPAGRLAGSVAAILSPGGGRTLRRVDASPADAPKVTDHIVRLWAAESAAHKAKQSSAAAAQFAAQYRIVTPWSGAVVLETAAQYREHDLDPHADSAVDQPLPGEPIPEPETWLLLGLGIVMLLVYRRLR